MNASQRKYYEKNKDKIAARIKARADGRMQFVAGWKAARGCCMCGEGDPDCLDLHHRDPGQKAFAVGGAFGRGCPMDRLLEELDKCDVLCANCHRKLHARERRGE